MTRRSLLPILSLLIVAACTTAEAVPVDDSTTSDAGLELENLARVVDRVHEKFTALAEAMPEDDLDWRPMDGVRSVEEVYIHMAADNWYVPALMGWEAPAETGVTNDGDTFRAYQEREMSREDMLAALDASFDFLRASMAESAGDLDREVELGQPTTVGDVWIRAVVHIHEHLGQSIAYARSNGVVPPWSR